GCRLRGARRPQGDLRPPRHPQPGQARAALAVRWSGMALTRPSLEARTVAGAALAILVVALPAVLAIEAVKGDDLAGEESSIWVLGALAVVVAFVIGGGIAGARRPETAIGHSVAAAALAFAVLVVVAIVRRVLDGSGLPASVAATF